MEITVLKCAKKNIRVSEIMPTCSHEQKTSHMAMGVFVVNVEFQKHSSKVKTKREVEASGDHLQGNHSSTYKTEKNPETKERIET